MPRRTGRHSSCAVLTQKRRCPILLMYKYVRTIAAGAALDGVAAGKNACVKLGLDVLGDGVVTGSVVCGGVGF